MGNPAEKTIRNPNLKPFLVKAQTPVNKKILFYRKFFFGLARSIVIQAVQHGCTSCICGRINANLDPSPVSA
jgi:hypothetical protein